MKYIIEHLEEEMYEWCVIEYKHMYQIVGKENLIVTNVKSGAEKISSFCEVVEERVDSVVCKKACLLDPNAEKELSPEDEFDCLVFGGILGDYPPRGRTGKVSEVIDVEKRSLGKEQMSTDTAVLVAKMIVDGKKLSEIRFKDHIELDIAEGEAVQLPYRYVLDDEGRPILPDGLIEYLENEGN